MNTLRRTASVAALLCLAGSVLAAGIGPGTAAPKLDVKTWVKGSPVKGFEKGKVYVVEFWATWCGPCITSIPHVTKLAKANQDVTFIGVSIWEDNDDKRVEAFVQKMGAQMDYNVGYSGNKEGMAVSWMDAAGQNGIPAAFIIKDQKIMWVGHPMSMDKPLAEVKAGTFDLAAHKAAFDKEAEQARKASEARAKLAAVQKLHADGKKSEANAALDAIVNETPAMKNQAEQIRFVWLSKDDMAAWEVKAASMAKDPAQRMNLAMFALNNNNPKTGSPEAAKKAMDMVLKASEEKDVIILYYGAFFNNSNKEYKKGLDLIEKAIALVDSSPMKDNAQFKEAMNKLRTELQTKATNG